MVELYKFLDYPTEQAYAYAKEHPHLLTNSVYEQLENLIYHTKYPPHHFRLLERQAMLAQIAANLLIRWNWQITRQLFLQGLLWLAHPYTQKFFLKRSQQLSVAAEHIKFVTNAIEQCVKEGPEPFVKAIDWQEIGNKLKVVQGNPRIEVVQQALQLIQDEKTYLWACLQIDLGLCLANSSSDNREQNIEAAIHAYQQGLQVLSRTQFPEEWADAQFSLGLAYGSRLGADHAQNMEDAIKAFKNALCVYTPEQYPNQWADTQNNLGLAYKNRLLGEPIHNIEKAIKAFKRVLQVRTRQHYPKEWAMAQINLGITYRVRLFKGRTWNLEQALQIFELVLQVITRAQYPLLWASTQLGLGNTYQERLLGEQPQNLEQAIDAYKQALLEYTHEEYAEQWATTQSCLGHAYKDRLRGERAQNIEQAIEACNLALQVYAHTRHPEEWAMAQINLGLAHRKRLRGDPAQNLEDAIQVFKHVLQVVTRTQYPMLWASTQYNLGTVYQERLNGDPAQNIEDAIQAYKLALQVVNREYSAERWASIQNNLGNTYLARLREERAQNVEDAIKAHQQALQVRTREHNPEQWATTQLNLGNSYAKRLRGVRAENIELAVLAYRQALQVCSCQSNPQKHRDICLGLGGLFYGEQRWAEARAAFESAHEALLLLRAETQREESRRRLSQDNVLLYSSIIHCCLQLGDVEAAAAYAMASKSRSLTELLAGDARSLAELLTQDPALAQEWEPIQALRDELENRVEENRQRAELGLSPIGGDVAALRQEIIARTDTLLFHYPALAAVQPLPPLTVSQAQDLSAELGNVPLIEFIEHAAGLGAFIITSTGIAYFPLADELMQLIGDDVTAIITDTFWVKRVGSRLALQDQSVALQRLYALLIAPLRPYLPAAGPLVLAPTSLLHLVPFQALLDEQGHYVSDSYALSFVPSLATLHVLYQQRQRSQAEEPLVLRQRLLSVAYPGSDPGSRDYLEHALLEATAIRHHFQERVELLAEEALPERVLEAAATQPYEAVHLICHGRFDWEHPLSSSLLLADGQELTVNDIRLRLRLQGRPLVALSACQTGHIRPEQGDEATGLAWAFLAAGASTVVSSQWSVPDEAARELFEAFYPLRREGISDAEALRQVMKQLRQSPRYRHPLFWAAFHVLGLPIA